MGVVLGLGRRSWVGARLKGEKKESAGLMRVEKIMDGKDGASILSDGTLGTRYLWANGGVGCILRKMLCLRLAGPHTQTSSQ